MGSYFQIRRSYKASFPYFRMWGEFFCYLLSVKLMTNSCHVIAHNHQNHSCTVPPTFSDHLSTFKVKNYSRNLNVNVVLYIFNIFCYNRALRQPFWPSRPITSCVVLGASRSRVSPVENDKMVEANVRVKKIIWRLASKIKAVIKTWSKIICILLS